MVKESVEELIKQLSNLRLQYRARQEEILSEIREAELREEAEDEATDDYRVGDRVRITTTRASRPEGATANERDRTATVTRVAESRIYLRTDNNFDTWRARSNITPLPLGTHRF
jgi:hypothetical protein